MDKSQNFEKWRATAIFWQTKSRPAPDPACQDESDVEKLVEQAQHGPTRSSERSIMRHFLEYFWGDLVQLSLFKMWLVLRIPEAPGEDQSSLFIISGYAILCNFCCCNSADLTQAILVSRQRPWKHYVFFSSTFHVYLVYFAVSTQTRDRKWDPCFISGNLRILIDPYVSFFLKVYNYNCINIFEPFSFKGYRCSTFFLTCFDFVDLNSPRIDPVHGRSMTSLQKMSGPLCIPSHASTKCSWRSAGENRTKMDERHGMVGWLDGWLDGWMVGWLDGKKVDDIWNIFCCTSMRNLQTRPLKNMRAEWTKYSESEQAEFERSNSKTCPVCHYVQKASRCSRMKRSSALWRTGHQCSTVSWAARNDISQQILGVKDHHYQSGHAWKSNMSRRQFNVHFNRRHSGSPMLYHPISYIIPRDHALSSLSSIHASNMAFTNHVAPTWGILLRKEHTEDCYPSFRPKMSVKFLHELPKRA